MCFGVLFLDTTAAAQGLKIAPLEYRTNIAKGDRQKGYIDISNPTDKKVTVATSVQAFRQIDNQGTLQFYDDDQVASGVLLDLDDFELGPKEAVRMYFLLDSTKLPTGDVFAAIFFTTQTAGNGAGVGQAVKLGTVLSIVNGTPGSRSAQITGLSLPGLVLGDEVRGTYSIKNTADPRRTTGFYPQVRVSSFPFGQSKETPGKLLFAGRTRTNEFTLNLPPLGIYKVETVYGASSQSRWVVVAQPFALLVLALVGVAVFIMRRYQRRLRAPAFRIK